MAYALNSYFKVSLRYLEVGGVFLELIRHIRSRPYLIGSKRFALILGRKGYLTKIIRRSEASFS